MKAAYFGCVGASGHFMHEPPGRITTESSVFCISNPWGLEVDGKLCPPGHGERGQPQGLARLHHKDGWSALAFWDRSIDGRPNSCSVFLAEGEHSFDGMQEIARRNFPEVTKRFGFALTLDASE